MRLEQQFNETEIKPINAIRGNESIIKHFIRPTKIKIHLELTYTANGMTDPEDY